MITYAERKALLDKLAPHGLKAGDWVWLKATPDHPRRKAQLHTPLEVVIAVKVAPESASDDGMRVLTIESVEGPA